MDVAQPYKAVGPTADTAVLRALAGTTKPLTGRQVARLVPEFSRRAVLDALTRLSEHGLVIREEAGNAFLFALNRDHLASPAVEILADMRNELVRRLREAIAAWDIAPDHASLFGSAARGDGDTASDIDLFVVRPADVDAEDERWREQLNRLSDDVGRWTGNHVSISEVSADDVKRLRRERPPVVEEVCADAVALAGPEARKLLAESERT